MIKVLGILTLMALVTCCGFTTGYVLGQHNERDVWTRSFPKAIRDTYNDGFADGEQNYLLHTCPRNGVC